MHFSFCIFVFCGFHLPFHDCVQAKPCLLPLFVHDLVYDKLPSIHDCVHTKPCMLPLFVHDFVGGKSYLWRLFFRGGVHGKSEPFQDSVYTNPCCLPLFVHDCVHYKPCPLPSFFQDLCTAHLTPASPSRSSANTSRSRCACVPLVHHCESAPTAQGSRPSVRIASSMHE